MIMEKKQAAIRKINQMGKVGGIITLILKIIIIIAMISVMIVIIMAAVNIKNGIMITWSDQMNVSINMEEIMGNTLSDEEIREIEDVIQYGKMNITISKNNQELEVRDYRVDDTMVELDLGSDESIVPAVKIYIVLSAIIMNLAMVLIVIIFVGRLCKAFKTCETPFEDNVIRRMQQLAISLIPWGCTASVFNSVINGFWTDSYSLDLSVDLGKVMVILIIFALVFVFKYGAMLQQESDETL